VKNLLTQIIDRLTDKEQRQALALAEETGWVMAQKHFEHQDFSARHFATAETYFIKIVEPARLHRDMDDEVWTYWTANRRQAVGRLDPRVPVFVHAWNSCIRQKLVTPASPAPDLPTRASR